MNLGETLFNSGKLSSRGKCQPNKYLMTNKKIYFGELFTGFRERASEHGQREGQRETEREREKERERDFLLSMEPDAGLHLTTLRS